jgi:hypothetical protein
MRFAGEAQGTQSEKEEWSVEREFESQHLKDKAFFNAEAQRTQRVRKTREARL